MFYDFSDIEQLEKELRNKINNLLPKTKHYNRRNLELLDYFQKSAFYDNIRARLPHKFKHLKHYVPWGEKVVTCLNDRISLRGFTDPNNYGIQEIYDYSRLDSEINKVHLSASIYGVCFVTVGVGDTNLGEPPILIKPESIVDSYGKINYRTGRVDYFITTYEDEGITYGSYYDDKIIVIFENNGSTTKLIDYYLHKLGQTPVIAFVNDPTIEKPLGKSEISSSVISNINAAQSTLTDMRIASENYATPQRVILNAPTGAFTDNDGNVINSLELSNSKMLILEQSNDNPNNQSSKSPTIDQFDSANPTYYSELLDRFALQIATEKSIPEEELGIHLANQPSTADATRLKYDGIAKRASRAANEYGYKWQQVLMLSLLIRDNKVPNDFMKTVKPKFDSFDIRTPAAQADSAVKLVSSGILPSDAEITKVVAGLTYDQINALQAELEAKKGTANLSEELKAISEAKSKIDQTVSNAMESIDKVGNGRG